MNNKQMDKIINNQLNKCKKLLITKSKEYQLTPDRLAHFKNAAVTFRTSPKEALLGEMGKHIISIIDMCKSNQTFTIERWEEKITDTMNYLILLRGLVSEELNEDTNT